MPEDAHPPTRGPLRVSSRNRRYFEDRDGRIVYLVGTHTWNSLQDEGPLNAQSLDFDQYLDFLVRHGHNFMRLWIWEQFRWASWSRDDDYRFSPLPFARSDQPGALDGGPKFDLWRFDEDFFDRLRDRVRRAGARGIYVSIMLFQGFSVGPRRSAQTNCWHGHPMYGANNINDLDLTSWDGWGWMSHLPRSAAWPVQERYIERVVDTVSDLDNVLYEVSNEDNPPPWATEDSLRWAEDVVATIRAAESRRGVSHPVGITWICGLPNDRLLSSNADWISPHDPDGQTAAATATGEKVVIWDTDHTSGLAITPIEAWTALVAGMHAISMDHVATSSDVVDRIAEKEPAVAERLRTRDLPSDANHVGYLDSHGSGEADFSSAPADLALGATRGFADALDLGRLRPAPAMASSGLCLAADGGERVAVAREKGRLEINLPKLPVRAWLLDWYSRQVGTPEFTETADGRAVTTLDRPGIVHVVPQ